MSRLDELFRLRAWLEADLIRFGCSDMEARDIAHDALMATAQKLDTIRPGAERTYVRTAARRRAINAGTRGPDELPLDEVRAMTDKTPSPEAALIRQQEIADFKKRFATAFATLPRDVQDTVVLRKHGHSLKKIAEILGVPLTTVQSRLHRATKHFREQVGEPPKDVDWLELTGDDDDHET